MDIKQEIKKFFNNKNTSLIYAYGCEWGPGYAGINEDSQCFFSIPVSAEKKDFRENFSGVAVYSKFNNANNKYELIFCCYNDNALETFIDMAINKFLKSTEREELFNAPEKFADSIRQTFGNSNTQDPVADKIAELYIFEKLLENDFNAQFGGFKTKSSIDIECNDFDIEVKSTTMHHNWIFHSSPEQLKYEKSKPLYLFFVRLEPTSIVNNAYSIQSLNDSLKNRGIAIDNLAFMNTSDKERLYKIKDLKIFEITENFPYPQLPVEANGVKLVSFALDLDPVALNALTLDEFLSVQNNTESAAVGSDVDDAENNIDKREKVFPQSDVATTIAEANKKNEKDLSVNSMISFYSFKITKFDRSFINLAIEKLKVPDYEWNYETPVTGKKAFKDFLNWYWDNHRNILEKRISDPKYTRYASNAEELEGFKGPDLHQISENCWINYRWSLSDICKEMQNLLIDAYGNSLEESSGITFTEKKNQDKIY